MRIYIVEGTREGQMCNILVTTNIEKAKSMIIDDGYNIEVWENACYASASSKLE